MQARPETFRNNSHFSERLLKTIKERHLDEHTVSTQTGVPEGALMLFIKNGRIDVLMSEANELAKFLGVDANWLITGQSSDA